jgi:hypothetical protein
MGVTEDMIAVELGNLFAPLLAQAAASGLLEELVRMHLAPFYRSDVLRAVLDAH